MSSSRSTPSHPAHPVPARATEVASAGLSLRFGLSVLDTRRGELRLDGKAVPLQPRVYALLCHLVHKHDLLQAV